MKVCHGEFVMGMLHAWVRHSVLNCNVFKTKVHNPADRTMGTAMPGLKATAALPLMYSGMAAWLGHATIPFSTPGASIAGAEACTA